MTARPAFPFRDFLVARTYEPQADAVAILVADALAKAVGDVAVVRVEDDALDRAARHAALAVVGTPARRRPSDMPGGDASQLAARLRVPVVAVPGGRAAADLRSCRSIVCGVRTVANTPCATAVGTLADALDLQLVLAHVTSHVSVGAEGGAYVPAASSIQLAQDRADARELLGDVARRAGRAAPGASCPRLASGAAAEQLCRIGSDERAALIAVTASGAGRLASAIRGSVARDVVRQADRPVLVWPREPDPALTSHPARAE
jgi:nucleotide-binding universal stress UspA family protein